MQRSVSCSDSWCLKLVREIWVSSFSDFCNSFQSLAAENCKERWPKEELALRLASEKLPAGARAMGGCCYADQWAEKIWDALFLLISLSLSPPSSLYYLLGRKERKGSVVNKQAATPFWLRSTSIRAKRAFGFRSGSTNINSTVQQFGIHPSHRENGADWRCMCPGIEIDRNPSSLNYHHLTQHPLPLCLNILNTQVKVHTNTHTYKHAPLHVPYCCVFTSVSACVLVFESPYMNRAGCKHRGNWAIWEWWNH